MQLRSGLTIGIGPLRENVVIAIEKVAPLPKEKVKPSEKVTPSEEVEKGTNILNDMKEPVYTTRINYLDKFQGQSTVSTGWLNIYQKWLKRKFSILKPDFYKKPFEKYIEGQDIETYKTFVIPFDNTKVNLSMRNDSVTLNKEKKKESDDE